MSALMGLSAAVDLPAVLELVSRLLLDLGFVAALVLLVHRRIHRSPELVFTFFVFNVVTFFVCALLRKVPMELGFALGLFAVFGILRYRTQAIRVRDLTYMFTVIALALVNALANDRISLPELLLVNGTIVAVAAGLELHGARTGLIRTPVLFDDLSLIGPRQEAALREELRRRTGLDVREVELVRVDLLRDSAELLVSHSGTGACSEAEARSPAVRRGSAARLGPEALS